MCRTWISRSRAAGCYRLSITLETDVCIEAPEEALTRFGAPEIFNTDQVCFNRPLLAAA